MKVNIERLDDAFHMRASNENGNTIEMDTSASHGGSGQGVSPMQLLLAGVGGCSAIDIISILKKQKQPLGKFTIEVDGSRVDATPSVFEKIKVTYRLHGDLDENKVRKAIDLSVEKYCSVSKMLEKTAEIETAFEIIRD
ncbi:osmotically inducible protein C [Fulvitalea axinellae]|uniref:Osmotically inducible protein C n=1 Tax=Fulvitalea axinellae TaxID=1182444 RepID=A0AAU9CQ58_9BACT|nr:osmotically inducible protein C [Fulvitalea axinellae]